MEPDVLPFAPVNPPPLRHPVSVLRVVLTVVLTTVLGSAIGIYVAVKIPKTYPMHAVILSPAHAKHPSRITRLRAELVAHDLDLANRWDVPFDEAADKVADSVKLEPAGAGGLKVNVVTRYYRDSRLIARTIAQDLRTPEHEAALAAKWKGVSAITAAEQKDLSDVTKLESLLTDDAMTAGFDSYAIAISEAVKGDEKAIALTRGEDFTRRHTMIRDLTKKLGFELPPGVPVLASDNLVEFGPFGVAQVSPASKLAIHLGRFGGLAAGGLLVWALLRWKPGFLRPAPRMMAAPAVPSASSGKPGPSHDDPW